jgi:uncharacterized small protein (DUF1192 family)
MAEPTTGRISNQELVGKDIFAMSSKELKQHMADLLDERRRLKNSVVPSVTECDNLLGLSQAELNSRSSARLAKVALFISVISILASAGLSIFA